MVDRLFVYGSLRPAVRDSRFELLAADAIALGPATTRGRLVLVRDYPGLLPSDEESARVHGELFGLERPVATLARLDAYEGCGPDDPEPHAFRRVEQLVRLASGREEIAWVYAYVAPDERLPRIASGAYLDVAPRMRAT